MRARSASFRRLPVLLLLAGLSLPLAGLDPFGMEERHPHAIVAGNDLDWQSSLGFSLRTVAAAQWRAQDWLALRAGLRLSLRELWPGSEQAPGAPAPFDRLALHSDAQFAEALVIFWEKPVIDFGLRLLHTGLPGTAAGYLSLIPSSGLDLGWLYGRGGFALRWWLDGASDPAGQFEIQTLALLGLRIPLGIPERYLRVELNTGGDFETSSLQALALVLGMDWPAWPGWQARAEASVRGSGGVTFAVTPGRLNLGFALRYLP